MSLTFTAETDKLVPALVKALAQLREPDKGGRASVPGRPSYTYMVLPDLLGEVRRVFAEHGLAILQTHTSGPGGAARVTTTVVHESGQMMVTPELEVTPREAQMFGSASTYGKRYQLAGLVGLAGTDDDDAHTAVRETQAARPKSQQHPPPPPTPPPSLRPDDRPAPPAVGFTRGNTLPGSASPASVKAMWALLKHTGMTEVEIRGWVAAVLQIDADWSTKDLSQSQISRIIDRLKAEEQQTPPPEPENR